MFKFDEICELIRLVSSTKVASVEIEHGGTRLRIDGVPQLSMVAAPADQAAVAAATALPVDAPAADGEAAAPGEEDLHYVISPIVGTFYRAPNPDAEPYIRVGAAVDEGTILCIIEAMKLMNEIENDCAGTIVKVFPENAQAVEYGERLFAVRKN